MDGMFPNADGAASELLLALSIVNRHKDALREVQKERGLTGDCVGNTLRAMLALYEKAKAQADDEKAFRPVARPGQ